MAIEFMKAFDEIINGVHKVCDGVMDASEGLKQGRFKKKTGDELWNIFENTIGAGILGALEGALHVVESANEALDVLEHKAFLLESGLSEEEYEKLDADETDVENMDAMLPAVVRSVVKCPGGKKAACGVGCCLERLPIVNISECLKKKKKNIFCLQKDVIFQKRHNSMRSIRIEC